MGRRWQQTLLGTAALLAWGLSATAELREELRDCPFKIVYESYRDDNWELMLVNADGSNPMNLTQTPDLDELYPHASPDGTKVVYLLEEGEGDDRTRNVYCMNIDGTNRLKVGENGRQPFWSPDGTVIAYAVETDVRFTKDPYANDHLFFHNIETGQTTQHPKPDISGLLNACWSPDGNWIIASAIRAMGFNQSTVALHAREDRVVELIRSTAGPDDLYQCRPDISPDGRQVAWGTGNTAHKDYMWVEVADVDLTQPAPKLGERRKVVQVDHPQQTYHVDWSPDGRYLAYGRGPLGSRMQPAPYVIGRKAKGWDIWIVNSSTPDVTVPITHDGLSNKEPDWVFVAEE